MNKALDVRLLGVDRQMTNQILTQLYRLIPNVRFTEEGLEDIDRINDNKFREDSDLQELVDEIKENTDKFYILVNLETDPEVIGVFTGITQKLNHPFVDDYPETYENKELLKGLFKDFGTQNMYFYVFHKKYVKDTKTLYARRENRNLPSVERDLSRSNLKKQIAVTLNELETGAVDTEFEYDNFLKVAEGILKRSKTEEELTKNMSKSPYRINYFTNNTSQQRRFSDNFDTLVRLLALLKYPHLAKSFDVYNIDVARVEYKDVQKLDYYDYYTLELDYALWRYTDASGYTVDLARYLKKKIEMNPATPERAEKRAQKTFEDYEKFLKWLKPKIDTWYNEDDFEALEEVTKKLRELQRTFYLAESQTKAMMRNETYGEKPILEIFNSWLKVSQQIYAIKDSIEKI